METYTLDAKDKALGRLATEVVSLLRGKNKPDFMPNKDSGGNITISDIENLPNKIDGINSIKINKIIASVTIIYEPTIFKPKLWEDLVKNENIEELTILINELAKEVI